MKEILGAYLVLENPNESFLLNKRRALSPIYGVAEFLWYFKKTMKIKFIERYAPQYKKFANGDVALGAYGARWSVGGKDQLFAVTQALEKDPFSRRVVVTMYHPNDIFLGMRQDIKDIPCTCTWQFLIRDDVLHMITNMRSQDIWLGLPYDMFVNTLIQKTIATELHVGMGTYTHQVGSLHLYEKHFTAAATALHATPLYSATIFNEYSELSFTDISELHRLELQMRAGNEKGVRCHLKKFENTLMYDLAACLSTQWLPSPIQPQNLGLQKGVQNYVDRRRR